jgi:hypothetical protein
MRHDDEKLQEIVCTAIAKLLYLPGARCGVRAILQRTRLHRQTRCSNTATGLTRQLLRRRGVDCVRTNGTYLICDKRSRY